MIQPNVEVFDREWKKYDDWYDQNPLIFQSELKALSKVIPSGKGIEIGVGSGRFASFFHIPFGVDPAFSALCLSAKRNISVAQGIGEELPFKDRSFHFALIVATLCFVKNPLFVLRETYRVLKYDGTLVLAIINRSSAWGRFLQQKISRSLFLKNARLFESEEIFSLLQNTKFQVTSTVQTLLLTPPEVKDIEEPQKGFGKGGFVVYKADKKTPR